MDSSIIFAKKYSRIIQGFCDAASSADEVKSEQAGASIDTDDYVRKLITESVCVIMPERIDVRNYFIDLAKKIAEAYLIDIVIKEHNDRISVMYTLDCDAGFHCLKPIIQLADEFSFHNRKNAVVISLDYYTHATYHSGHQVLPLND